MWGALQTDCPGRCRHNRQEHHGICVAIPDRLCGRSGWCAAFPFDGLGFVRVAEAVNKNIALLFLLLNLGGVAVWCFSDLFLIASQLLLSGADYLKVFQSDQLQALSMACLYIYKMGSQGLPDIL